MMSTSPKLPTHLPGLARGPRNIKQITAVPIPGKNERDRNIQYMHSLFPPADSTDLSLSILVLIRVAYIYVQ